MSVADAALSARVKALASELGFARVGIARAEPLVPEAMRLHEWLDAGHHGTMEYMQRTAAVRADPCHPGMLQGARSVVVLVAPYAGDATPVQARPLGLGERGSNTGPTLGRVARYAQGRDYHDVLHKRLRPVTRLLREAGHEARAAVDTMPVFERAWAQRAGVGFIGKNCCLIVPGLGSHVFLAAVVTSAELCADEPMRERCGECRLCLDVCPTEAFVGPRRLDARRCISYLTIEHKGAIDPELRADIGDWVFGCDACQDVCPFNRTQAAPAHASAHESTRAFGRGVAAEAALGAVVGADGRGLDAEALVALDEPGFASLTQGSPLRRAKREGLVRNAAIVLGNRGTGRSLPVLQRAAESDASEVAREAARWAIERIEERGE
jgi:epoxyqueuosine reductase